MWQDVPVQLVDLPPISPEFVEPWVPNVIRSADAALLVADLAQRRRGGRDARRCSTAWRDVTPSSSASFLTTSRTSGSATSRR